MTDLNSEPVGEIQGKVRAPPSKSITHRAIVLSMLSHGRSTIQNPLVSGDTMSTLRAAELMGAEVHSGKSISVLSSAHQATDVINAENSGTTARLLSSVCALFPGHAVITGDSSLRKRPMQPIMDAVSQLGGTAFSTNGNGMLPAVFGGRMKRQRASLRGDISSQFASSLAISCPLKKSDTSITLTGRLQSSAYLKLTLEMVAAFGCRTELEDRVMRCEGGGSYRGRVFTVPGDFSSAAFLLAAGAATGGEVVVRGLSDRFTQADSAIVGILKSLGCSVRSGRDSVSVLGGELAASDIDCSESPDLFPIACILAACSTGTSIIRGTSNLRFKETDRLLSTLAMLKDLGVSASIRGTAITVRGGKIRGGRVRSLGDHRIAMAGCVAGMASEKGCLVSDGGTYRISYPRFLDDINSIGGRVSVI